MEDDCMYFFYGSDVVDFNRVNEPSRVLFVTVHCCGQSRHPVSDKDLHQIFSHYGTVERMGYSYYSEVEFLFKYNSVCDAWAAKLLNGQCLYDNCCRLQVQFFHWKVEEESITLLNGIVEDELCDVDSDLGKGSCDESQLELSDKQPFLLGGESLIQLTKEVAAPHMIETGYIIDVEIPDMDYAREISGLGLSSVLESETADIREEFHEVRDWSCFPIFDPGILSIKDGVSCLVVASPLHLVIEDPLHIHVGALSDTCRCTLIKSRGLHNPVDLDLFRRLHHPCGTSTSGLFSVLETGTHEVLDGFKELGRCNCFRVFDPGIFTHKVEFQEKQYKEKPVLFLLQGLNTDIDRFSKPAEFQGIENFQTGLSILHHVLTECLVLESDLILAVLQLANDISSEALVQVLKKAKLGMKECQFESIFLDHTYMYGGCRHFSYTRICATGGKSFVLHYGHATTHNMTLEDGGMALLDMGAEYYLYGSDITYSFMVNGKFKRDQKTISNAVLDDAHDAIIATRKPKAKFNLESSHQLPLLDLGSLRLEEFDPFWIATLDSTIETQQCLTLMNLVSTCNNELFLTSMAQRHLKILLKGVHVILGKAMVRDYDGFNGPGCFHGVFDFVLALVRDYDGFNGPGHLEDKVSLRGGLCYGII